MPLRFGDRAKLAKNWVTASGPLKVFVAHDESEVAARAHAVARKLRQQFRVPCGDGQLLHSSVPTSAMITWYAPKRRPSTRPGRAAAMILSRI